jgi:hypothetical protein
LAVALCPAALAADESLSPASFPRPADACPAERPGADDPARAADGRDGQAVAHNGAYFHADVYANADAPALVYADGVIHAIVNTHGDAVIYTVAH